MRIEPRGFDWSFFEDGALALDQHEVWVEPVFAPKKRVSQARRLNPAESSATVPGMSAPRPRPRPRTRVRPEQQRRARRARRIAVALLLASVLVPTLLLSAFGGGSASDVHAAAPALATRLAPAGPPQPEIVATYSDLRLQLPIAQSRVTAVGYSGGSGGALGLSPVGVQANAGLFQRLWRRLVGSGSTGVRWYQLPGGQGSPTSALDVGAAPGTDVYSPVDGTIVGISDLILDGRPYGQRIEIQPADAPSIVVDVSHVRADPSLAEHGVGSTVVAGSSKLGTLLDFSSVERQALAHHTQDAGNHVLVEVHPAATLSLP